MIVVGDTSPLNYLVQIGCADVLSELYKQLLVPIAVAVELSDTRTPQVVRKWIETPPHTWPSRAERICC